MAKTKPTPAARPKAAPAGKSKGKPARAARTGEVVLEATGITKSFPGVLANDRVDFDLRKGEIHALLGENGAGKTTLMNILYGLYAADGGEIRVNGQLERITSPRDAIRRGIGMVHQHFMLVPVFTVAENIMLGDESAHVNVTRFPAWAIYLIGLGVTAIAATLAALLVNIWVALLIVAVGIMATYGRVTRLDRQGVAKRIVELSHQYGLEVDPQALVGQLPVGLQQRVEIVKALYRQANILILDEPTAVLTPQEVEDLFRIVRELTARGVSIIFITHKLKEVLAVADRITVMRAGRVVGTVAPKETSEAKLAAMMVGREVILKVQKGAARPKQEVLQVKDLSVFDVRGLESVRGLSFDVRAGEVLGIAGVQGNGQTELVEALTGLRAIHAGEIVSNGERIFPQPLSSLGLFSRWPAWARGLYVILSALACALIGYFLNAAVAAGILFVILMTPIAGPPIRWLIHRISKSNSLNPRTLIEGGLAHIPEDRQRHGLVLSSTVADNMVLCTYYRMPYGKHGVLQPVAIDENARRLVQEFDVRTPSPYVPTSKLSGGNQQKVIVARELSRPVKLLIANQPTRGLDVGSIEYIHSEIIAMRDRGVAVLLVSAELDEIMALSDRIAVMYRGQIVTVVNAKQATREKLGLWMAGANPED